MAAHAPPITRQIRAMARAIWAFESCGIFTFGIFGTFIPKVGLEGFLGSVIRFQFASFMTLICLASLEYLLRSLDSPG